MKDLIDDLPTLRPGEVGRRWFAKAGTFSAGGVKRVKCKIVAYVGAVTKAQVEVKISTSPVEMYFVRINADAITSNTLIGGTRDEASELIIDWQECE